MWTTRTLRGTVRANGKKQACRWCCCSGHGDKKSLLFPGELRPMPYGRAALCPQVSSAAEGSHPESSRNYISFCTSPPELKCGCYRVYSLCHLFYPLMNSIFLPSMVLSPSQVRIGMNMTLVGFAVWKLFIFYRTALHHCNEPFCRQRSQVELSRYLHALAELAWDRLRALLELGAPSLYPLALQPGWAGKGTATFTCQKSWCFEISLCGESEGKVETSESKRKQSPNCRLQLNSKCGK